MARFGCWRAGVFCKEREREKVHLTAQEVGFIKALKTCLDAAVSVEGDALYSFPVPYFLRAPIGCLSADGRF